MKRIKTTKRGRASAGVRPIFIATMKIARTALAIETIYGFFPGGDPREFSPDHESSTDEERARHKADCEAWDRGERPTVPVSGWVSESVHVTRSAYGLGTYTVDWDDEYDDDDDGELVAV